MALTYPTLGTVAPGDVLRANSGTAAYNDVIKSVNQHRKPPMCALTCSFTSLTINGAMGGGTYGTWTEDVDTDGMYSSGATMTVQTAGLYIITFNIWGNTSVTAQAVINAPAKVAHSTGASASPAWFGVSASAVVSLAANATIEGAGYLSGSSTGTAKMAAAWIGQAT